MNEDKEKSSPLRDYPMFEDEEQEIPSPAATAEDIIPPGRNKTGRKYTTANGKNRNYGNEECSFAGGEEEPPVYVFKIQYILFAILILLFLLAIFSYDPVDTSIIDGGTNAPLSNCCGLLGAHLSKFFFYVFGIATYPIVLLLTLCAVRSFIPVPMKRKGYFFSLIAAITGITLLMAVSPQDFALRTDSLGIGRMDEPLLALSGGALGALFAAPETKLYPAGFLRMYIGTVGTIITALALLLSGSIFIFLADWKDVIKRFLASKYPFSVPSLRRRSPVKDERVEEEEISPLITPGNKRKKEMDKLLSIKDDMGEREDDTGEDPEFAAFHAEMDKVLAEEEEEEEEENTVKEMEDEETSELKRIKVETEELSGNEESSIRTLPADTLSSGNISTDAYSVNQQEKALGAGRQTPEEVVYNGHFELPPVPMLTQPPADAKTEDAGHLNKAKATLQATLDSFDIAGSVSGTIVGPRITRFEITLEPGVKVDKVTGIQNNIAMDMCATSVRVLAPIPGKNAVGIEVPNKISNMVFIRELFESAAWKESNADIPIILGKDVAGKVIVTDLAKAPHLLIAGSTGSGKSVCMNTLIMSLLYKFSPFDLKLIMVDPKFVELEMYRPLPHLITPVVNDPKKVPFALRWGVNEMEHRYQMLARVKAKNLNAFNSRPKDPVPVPDENGDIIPQKLPYLLIIVDELADIMMTEAKSDVETSICRIAQKGRAAGIHLVIATQTPRKDIITGTIKANLPTKISFKVSNFTDSRVILDTMGAEKLLGKGDMLFKGPSGEMERIQGSMVSDPEIQRTVDFVSSQVPQSFNDTVLLEPGTGEDAEEPDDGANSFPEIDMEEEAASENAAMTEYIRAASAKYLKSGDDEKLRKALEIMLREGKISTSYLQRRMTIGYNTAAEIIDTFEKRGIVSAPLPGGQKRTILVFDELGRPE